MTVDILTTMDAVAADALARELGGHGSLVEALRASPEVVEVVVQDEYTHDIVLAGRADGLYVAYDTT